MRACPLCARRIYVITVGVRKQREWKIRLYLPKSAGFGPKGAGAHLFCSRAGTVHDADAKELVARQERHSIMNVDVVSFNRLAFRIFDELGMGNLNILEETEKSGAAPYSGTGAGQFNAHEIEYEKGGLYQ